MKTMVRYLAAVMLLMLTCSTSIHAAASPIPWEEVHFDTQYATFDCGGQPAFVMLDTEHKLAQWVPVVVNSNLAVTDGTYIIPETIQDNEGNTYTVVATRDRASSFDASLLSLMPAGMSPLTETATVDRISLPKTMRYIGKYSLYNLTAPSVNVPASVETLGSYAFSTSSVTLFFEGTKAPVVTGTPERRFVKVYCPEEAMDDYTYQFIKATGADLTYFHPIIIGGNEGRSVTVSLNKMGTLSLEILKKNGSLNAVNKLTVTGVININDWNTIISKMPNLMSVDLSGATTDNTTFNFAYGKNYSISDLSLPKGMRSIASLPLGNLENLVIPEGVKSIGGMPNTLTFVSLPNSLERVEATTFYHCSAVIDKIPAKLTYVGEDGFGKCDFGEELILPEGLEYIGQRAFCNINIKTISLPSTLRYADKAFFETYGTNEVTRIICHMGNPLAKKISSQSLNNATLVVPAISKQLYEKHEAWKDFAAVETFDYVPNTIYAIGDFNIEYNGGNYPVLDLHFNDYTTINYTGYGNVGTPSTMTINAAAPVNFKGFTLDYSGTAMTTATKTTTQAMWRSTPLLVNGSVSADEVAIRLNNINRKVCAFTLPFNADIQQIFYDNPDLHITIYEHSGASRTDDMKRYTNTWSVKQDGILKAGVGYFLLANDLTKTETYDEVAVLIKAIDDDKKQSIFTTADVSIPLELHKAEFPHNSNWNTLGNPYPCPFDTRFLSLSTPFTVWDTKNAKFYTYSPLDDKYILTPGQFFYIQRPEEGGEQETFSAEGRQIDYGVRKLTASAAKQASLLYEMYAKPSRQVWNISLSQDGNSDRTRVVFNPQATDRYDIGRDAVKFTSSEETEAQIYTISDIHALSINECPSADQPIQLGIAVPEDGEYTFCVTSNDEDLAPDTAPDTITLIDTASDTKTIITPGEDVTLSLQAGTYNKRFYLTFGNADITAITTPGEPDTAEEAPIFYTLSGQRIATPQRGIHLMKTKTNTKKIMNKQ